MLHNADSLKITLVQLNYFRVCYNIRINQFCNIRFIDTINIFFMQNYLAIKIYLTYCKEIKVRTHWFLNSLINLTLTNPNPNLSGETEN